MSQSTLVLITADPNHPIAAHAYRYVRALLKSKNALSNTNTLQTQVSVFFYAQAAHTANQLRWQTADQENLTSQWQKLSHEYDIALPVCVSTALARGVTDESNAKRHGLSAENLASGFKLVGLGDLADALSTSSRVMQF